MKDLKFTLYEVFGYLLPGAAMALAVSVLFWSIFLPKAAFSMFIWNFGDGRWAAGLVGCYLLGHICLSIGNVLFKPIEQKVTNADADKSKAILLAFARDRVAGQVGDGEEQLDPLWLNRYMDEYSVQSGAVGDREILVYREGFYRGNTIALGVLAIAILIRLIVGSASIKLPQIAYAASRYQLGFFVILAGVTAYLCFRRYEKFLEYRTNRALTAFVVANVRGNKAESNDHKED